MQPVLADLRRRLAPDRLLLGERARERGFADWSGAPAAPPEAVVLPCTPQEVALVLEVCAAHGQAVCVQGGLTGLAGGANPRPSELVLSLARLDQIEDFDAVGGTAIVQAGVTLERLQAFSAERGWLFPVDLGARSGCTLGGNAATNAGGNRVLRYGMMRDQVLGLEAALPGGGLMTMLDRVIKNNAGFDLKHLFIGSEGALGVITRLSLRLVPLPTVSRTALCGLDSFADAALLLKAARGRLAGLSSFELMWDDYFQAAATSLGRASPLEARYPLYAIIETLDADPETADGALARCLEDALGEGLIQDAVVAQSQTQAQGLWAFREAVSELLGSTKPNVAFDISIAQPLMDGFVQKVRAALEADYPDQQHLFFGHLGDGNLHLLSGPFQEAAELAAAEDVVYRAVEAVGGSISAEHGVGVIKKPFLHHSRPAAQVELMRAMKRSLDPQGILNPGRVFDQISLTP